METTAQVFIIITLFVLFRFVLAMFNGPPVAKLIGAGVVAVAVVVVLTGYSMPVLLVTATVFALAGFIGLAWGIGKFVRQRATRAEEASRLPPTTADPTNTIPWQRD